MRFRLAAAPPVAGAPRAGILAYNGVMKKLRTAFIVEFVAVLASIVVAYAADWRMPISPWIAAPAGLILWGSGLLYTLHLRGEIREAMERGTLPSRRHGYPMVEARAAMHLGAALGFRSWPTLIVAVVCAAVNLGLAVSMRRRLLSRLGPLRRQRPGWRR